MREIVQLTYNAQPFPEIGPQETDWLIVQVAALFPCQMLLHVPIYD
jgi:hypothetical protein